tara:strand:- start:274 stop:519 length:246 start_codon:yes stop_codon:yes gene_type:complete
MASALISEVRRKDATGGGTRTAIVAIWSSLIVPGPDGMLATKPKASAPAWIAIQASSAEAMQQTLSLVRMSTCLGLGESAA